MRKERWGILATNSTPDMTHESKLEAVRKAVIAAVPSIMDLKFGCVVQYNGADGNVHRGEYLSSEDASEERVWARVNIGYGHMDVRGIGMCAEDKLEIIGRPIRLADVLIAVREAGVAMRVDQKGRMQLEEMVEYHAQKNIQPSSTFAVHWVGCDWNLHKDSLDLQDPPTIDFLHSILCDQKTK